MVSLDKRQKQLLKVALPLALLTLTLYAADGLYRKISPSLEAGREKAYRARLDSLSATLCPDPVHIQELPEIGEQIEVFCRGSFLVLTRYSIFGYQSEIDLLVAYNPDEKRVISVELLGHGETPGLGDAIEPDQSPWLLEFSGVGYYPSIGVDLRPNRVSTISGATITTQALIEGLSEKLNLETFYE